MFLILIFLILFNLNIYSIDFEAKGIFKVEKFHKITSKYETTIKIRSIKKISENQFLALLTRNTFYAPGFFADQEEIEKKRKEGEEAVILKEEPKAEWKTFIAFISKNGRILQEGEETESNVPPEENFQPFEMEGNDFCPYGYVNKMNKKIMCYDFSLSQKSKIDVPINEITSYGLEVKEKTNNIWIIGIPEKSNKNFCIIYDFKKKKWQDVDFSIGKLYENLILKIRKEGDFKKDSINFYHIERDIINSTIDFVTSIDEILKTEEEKEIRKRHFFYCSLNSKGDFFAKKLKLIFEIGSSKNVIFEKDEGIVKLPSIYKQDNFSIFPIKDSLLFYNQAGISFNPEQKFLNVYISFFYFKTLNDLPDYYDDYGYLRLKLVKSFKENVSVFPFLIHLEKERFLFPAICFKDEKENEPCFVEADFVE